MGLWINWETRLNTNERAGVIKHTQYLIIFDSKKWSNILRQNHRHYLQQQLKVSRSSWLIWSPPPSPPARSVMMPLRLIVSHYPHKIIQMHHIPFIIAYTTPKNFIESRFWAKGQKSLFPLVIITTVILYIMCPIIPLNLVSKVTFKILDPQKINKSRNPFAISNPTKGGREDKDWPELMDHGKNDTTCRRLNRIDRSQKKWLFSNCLALGSCLFYSRGG